MARGRKTGGRQKGTRNRATEEARASAAATGVLPLAYMLAVMRDETANEKRRDAMAMAAAPYLHSKLTAIDAKLSPTAIEPGPESPQSLLRLSCPSATRTTDLKQSPAATHRSPWMRFPPPAARVTAKSQQIAPVSPAESLRAGAE
jgi:hypothetical protein